MSELGMHSMSTNAIIINQILELEIILNPNIYRRQNQEYHIFLCNIYQCHG
jgi:hypothetical protein